MKRLWNKILVSLMFNFRAELKPVQTDSKSRFWQITIIARDPESDPESDGFLTSALVEEGFRVNSLPLLLRVHDVEAIEIGETPYRLQPLPEDFKKSIQ